MKARLPKPRSQKLRKYMERETACEPCTDSAHPTGPAISIREHIMPPPTPLHGSLCDSEQKQLTENWQVMYYPPYLWKCTSCHPGDSYSGPLQSFSEFQFSYVSLIRGSNNEVQCKTAIEPKYVLLSLWPPKAYSFFKQAVAQNTWWDTPAKTRAWQEPIVAWVLACDSLERCHRAFGVWDWEQRIILCDH